MADETDKIPIKDEQTQSCFHTTKIGSKVHCNLGTGKFYRVNNAVHEYKRDERNRSTYV